MWIYQISWWFIPGNKVEQYLRGCMSGILKDSHRFTSSFKIHTTSSTELPFVIYAPSHLKLVSYPLFPRGHFYFLCWLWVRKKNIAPQLIILWISPSISGFSCLLFFSVREENEIQLIYRISHWESFVGGVLEEQQKESFSGTGGWEGLFAIFHHPRRIEQPSL